MFTKVSSKIISIKGLFLPLYMSTAYAFDGVDEKRYPRYFNTPNQVGLAQKIAALEGAEQALFLGLGWRQFLQPCCLILGLEIMLFFSGLYGGTTNLIVEEFNKFGIEYSFTTGLLTS